MKKVKDPIFGEGDAVKYDSTLGEELLLIAKAIRHYCWDKRGMSDSEWHDRMNYIYRQIIHSHVVLPTGEVIQKTLGQPSGTVSTTDDNCIIHLFVWCYMWRKLFGKSFFEAYHKGEINLALYADDHIFSVQKNLGIHDFLNRSKVYEELGLKLDPNKDLVTETLAGHTFLGVMAVEKNGSFIPYFNRVKLLNFLSKTEKQKFSVDQKFCRALSAGVLGSFDDECFPVIEGFLLDLKKKHPILRNKVVPSRSSFKRHWSSKEAGG